MSATLPILTALRTHLQAALPAYEVALFPDRPDGYRFIHPKGAVLIGYQGSKFTKLEALGMIAQQRDVTLSLTIMGVGWHSDEGTLAILDEVRLAIVGYRPPNCQMCHLIHEQFLSEDAGAWQYELLVQTETQQVQQITEPNLPKLTSVYTRQSTDPLNPDLTPSQNHPSP